MAGKLSSGTENVKGYDTVTLTKHPRAFVEPDGQVALLPGQFTSAVI